MPRQRRLNSDQLGEKGELRFAELCTDAGLNVNRVGRDRGGWDCFVQFPHERSASHGPLDSRPSPTTCLIQVKTIWSGSFICKGSLLSLEQLAKVPIPAFVVVLLVDESLECVNAYVIHLLGGNLARVLKRLRQEYAKGNYTCKNATISFRPQRDGLEVKLQGSTLRKVLTAFCGTDPHAYTTQKNSELRRAGFEDGSHTIQFNMITDGLDAVIDSMLGLRKARISNFRQTEKRFGIELSLQNVSGTSGEMEIVPNPIDQCDIVVRSAESDRPASISADLITTGLSKPPELRAMRLTSAAVDIIIRWHFRLFKITLKEKAIVSPVEWMNCHNMMKLLGSTETTVEILPRKRLNSLIVNLPRLSGIDIEFHNFMFTVCKNLKEIQQLCGLNDLVLTNEEIFELAKEASMAVTILNSNKCNSYVITFDSELIHDIKEAAFNWIDFLSIGGNCVGYWALVEFRAEKIGDKLKWTSTSIRPGEMKLLRGENSVIDDFISEIRRRTGIGNSIVQSRPIGTLTPSPRSSPPAR